MLVAELTSRFKMYQLMAEKTFQQLNDDQLLWRATEHDNSIAIIANHIAGNLRSRFTHFLEEDGEKPWRLRDEEFELDATEFDRSTWQANWQSAWEILYTTLGGLSEQDVQRTVFIRGEAFTVSDALLRQLAHYAYHVGQIVLLGKMQLQADWQTLSIPKGESKQHFRVVTTGGRIV